MVLSDKALDKKTSCFSSSFLLFTTIFWGSCGITILEDLLEAIYKDLHINNLFSVINDVTFAQIMKALSQMFGSYEATSWLNRSRRCLKGKSPADLLKEGESKKVGELLRQEKKYKKIKEL